MPWVLSNVVSGQQRLFQPYVQSARYVAAYRNYWWQHIRKAKTSAEIITPDSACPYPAKSDNTVDRPVADAGSNFGRLARLGIMDEYFEKIERQPLCGIECRYWRAFFKAFQDVRAESTIDRALAQIESLAGQDRFRVGDERAELVESILRDLRRLAEFRSQG